ARPIVRHRIITYCRNRWLFLEPCFRYDDRSTYIYFPYFVSHWKYRKRRRSHCYCHRCNCLYCRRYCRGYFPRFKNRIYCWLYSKMAANRSIIRSINHQYSYWCGAGVIDNAFSFGSEALPAPQAVLMSMLVDGIMSGNLPWSLVFIGAAAAATVELFGIG